MKNPYSKNTGKNKDTQRIVCDLDNDLVDRIDAWAVPKGYGARVHAIRHLLDAGLKAVESKND